MRLSIFAGAILVVPLIAAAQTPPPSPPPSPPPTPPGATKAAVAAGMTSAASTPQPIDVSKNGGPNSAFVVATQYLEGVRVLCTVLENDGKLFAECDNTTREAKMTMSPTYLPQLATEWEAFTRKIVDADFTVTGKRRPVVVMNNGVVMAESSSGGVVKLKR